MKLLVRYSALQTLSDPKLELLCVLAVYQQSIVYFAEVQKHGAEKVQWLLCFPRDAAVEISLQDDPSTTTKKADGR